MKKFMLLSLMLIGCSQNPTDDSGICHYSKLTGTHILQDGNKLEMDEGCNYTQTVYDSSTHEVMCVNQGVVRDFTLGKTSGQLSAQIRQSTCTTPTDEIYNMRYEIDGSNLTLFAM